MNTVILILAGVILIAVTVIAVTGNRNLNKFHNNMDKIYDDAQKEAQEYINRLNEQ